MDATKTKAPNSFTRSHGRGATMACTSIDVATAGGQKCWDHGGGFVGLCIFGGGTLCTVLGGGMAALTHSLGRFW